MSLRRLKVKSVKMKITNPALFAICFFKLKSEQEAEIQDLSNALIKKFSLEVYENKNHIVYRSGNNYLEQIRLYDIVALRLCLMEAGEHPPNIWQGLREHLDTISADFLGLSILYFGLTDDKSDPSTIIEAGLNLSPKLPTNLEYGFMAQVKDYDYESKTIEYALISQTSLEDHVKEEFLFARDRGFLKLESYLHKEYDQIRRYSNNRKELFKSLKELDEKAIEMINAINIQSHPTHKPKLNEVSERYAKFVAMNAKVSTLLNVIQTNILNYKKHIDLLPKKDDNVFDLHLKRFEKEERQIKFDLNRCNSTINSVSTGLELLRSTDSAKMQKQGLIKQTALAVLEVVFVLYTSISLWKIVVDDSVWRDISPLSKLGFGFTLAVILPLFAHFLVEKKWKYSAACLVVILMAVACACWVTSSLSVRFP